MEELFSKIKGYVKMDTEISAEEFMGYYKAVIDKLTADFEKMTEDEMLKAKIITSIVAANAATRAKRKTADSKKFKKAHEKSNFWTGAIDYRLTKSGLSEEEISRRSKELEDTLQ